MTKLKRSSDPATSKKPKFLLTGIAVLTLISALSTGALLGVFAVQPSVIFVTSSAIGILGVYTYHRAALLYLHLRFKNL